MINIKDIILDIARQKGLSGHQVAKMSGINPQTFYRSINNNDMPVSRLQKLSGILDYDLFQFYPARNITPSPEIKTLRTENQQLKQQIQNLQNELTLLKDVLQLLKAQIKP